MAEATEVNADPSMEEILASIRKIISDEVPPAAEVAPANIPAAPPEPAEEILELTQVVEEEKAPDLPPPPPPPAQMPEPEPVAPPPMAAEPVPAPVAPEEPLVSEPVASRAASTLSSLANTLEIERLSASPNGMTFIGNGHRTLEDMVIEMMRPLLRDWFDKNLPAIVERLVQKEIERIAKRS